MTWIMSFNKIYHYDLLCQGDQAEIIKQHFMCHILWGNSYGCDWLRITIKLNCFYLQSISSQGLPHCIICSIGRLNISLDAAPDSISLNIKEASDHFCLVMFVIIFTAYYSRVLGTGGCVDWRDQSDLYPN